MKKNEGDKISRFNEVCDIIANSATGLKKACEQVGISHNTIYNMLDDPEHEKRYARARRMQAELLTDETIDIADDTTGDTEIIFKDGKQVKVENKEWVNRSRLRIDARKWLAAKLHPKKYGDKVDVTTDGKELKQNTTIIWGANQIEI